jgi:hypothetical protein
VVLMRLWLRRRSRDQRFSKGFGNGDDLLSAYAQVDFWVEFGNTRCTALGLEL